MKQTPNDKIMKILAQTSVVNGRYNNSGSKSGGFGVIKQTYLSITASTKFKSTFL